MYESMASLRVDASSSRFALGQFARTVEKARYGQTALAPIADQEGEMHDFAGLACLHDDPGQGAFAPCGLNDGADRNRQQGRDGGPVAADPAVRNHSRLDAFIHGLFCLSEHFFQGRSKD